MELTAKKSYSVVVFFLYSMSFHCYSTHSDMILQKYVLHRISSRFKFEFLFWIILNLHILKNIFFKDIKNHSNVAYFRAPKTYVKQIRTMLENLKIQRSHLNQFPKNDKNWYLSFNVLLLHVWESLKRRNGSWYLC